MGIKNFLQKFYPIPTRSFYNEMSRLHAEIARLQSDNEKLYANTAKLNIVVPEHIVVSLTTYSPRFSSVCHTLRTLFNQTLKPNRIIVYLDCSEDAITEEMRSLIPFGIEYRFNCENIKAHKKYYFAFKEFPESLVITVDDDVLYPADMVESLYRSYKNHPDCVSARRVHKMKFDSDGKILPYGSDWGWECKNETEPSHLLFATGVGGVLYPPHCMDGRIFEKETMIANCLENDDIWLKTMEILKGTKVVWVANTCMTPPIVEGSQQVGLCYTNVEKGGNDTQIANMLRLYGKEIEERIGEFKKAYGGGTDVE